MYLQRPFVDSSVWVLFRWEAPKEVGLVRVQEFCDGSREQPNGSGFAVGSEEFLLVVSAPKVGKNWRSFGLSVEALLEPEQLVDLQRV